MNSCPSPLLQRSLARIASEHSVAAALTFLRRLAEGSSAVRSALADVVGWDVMVDPDNDGRGRSVAAAANHSRRGAGPHSSIIENWVPHQSNHRGVGVAASDSERHGERYRQLSTHYTANAGGGAHPEVDAGESLSSGSAAHILRAYSAKKPALVVPSKHALAASGPCYSDITALRVIQSLVHRDAAVSVAENALEEVRQ